ncbi:hypothetical protein SUGI_0911340 [Cryptomeria japonica]|uniref:pentatricopeptide repeat-containing protein At5g39710 n=1 Tax=Cryptomeria japonica TaxID=3369 RepID=UPI0024148D6C|nr:pentatricopeptide repeat-containing protein At5g39710 [Cryptomeria japonica]GLJ43777.1 hypothetical protein SUGI_0911340 [Cryptomeria japonica]
MPVLKSAISHGNVIQVHNPMPVKVAQLSKPHLHQPSTAPHFYTSRRGRRGLNIVRLAIESSGSVHKFCEEGRYGLAVEYVREMISKGSMPDKLALAAVIQGLCEKNYFAEAAEFVLVICPPDVATYNCLIDALCQMGQLGLAMATMGLMREKGVVLDSSNYTDLIDRFHGNSLEDEAVGLKEETTEKGVEPTSDASLSE